MIPYFLPQIVFSVQCSPEYITVSPSPTMILLMLYHITKLITICTISFVAGYHQNMFTSSNCTLNEVVHHYSIQIFMGGASIYLWVNDMY